MRNIMIVQADETPLGEQGMEMVERKGIGHPDSLMDGICERASLELSRYYIKEFGNILHHNLDKGLLVGGSAKVGFGKGRITKPIEIIIAGRATKSFNGKAIPVDKIVVNAAKHYLKENTRFLDIAKETKISTKILGGSEGLTKLFSRGDGFPRANDTSFGIGFAPMTKTERLTLEMERFLNSKAYKKKVPATGEDIKVMCIRENDSVHMNIAVAFVAELVGSMNVYSDLKEKVRHDAEIFAKSIIKNVNVSINTGDLAKSGEVYITKSGLSCESGDDGQVGRGNRVNGLITPFRHMSLEASAGKNPVNHTGKIYNILSKNIAEEIAKQSRVSDCTVAIASYIGERIDRPRSVVVKASMKKGSRLSDEKDSIKKIAEANLDNVALVSKGLLSGKYTVF